jgi:hypothetical protein
MEPPSTGPAGCYCSSNTESQSFRAGAACFVVVEQLRGGQRMGMYLSLILAGGGGQMLAAGDNTIDTLPRPGDAR